MFEPVPVYPIPPDPGLIDLVQFNKNYSSLGDGGIVDSGEAYVDIQAFGIDFFNIPCLIIGEGEAELRWTTGDDFLRWLGSDADLRWDATYRLGTGQC